MKRRLLILMALVMVLACSVAYAAPIQVNGLNEVKLYDLYSQVQIGRAHV